MKTKDAERQAKYRKTGRTFTVTIRDPQAVEALQVQAALYGGITAAITRLLRVTDRNHKLHELLKDFPE